MTEEIVARHAKHRAAIRSAVINAALDLNDFSWTSDEDELLDTLDDWLDAKAKVAQVLMNVRPAAQRAVEPAMPRAQQLVETFDSDAHQAELRAS